MSIGVTRWPLLTDVIVVLAVGGRLKPAFGPPINATASLIRGCILATRGRPINCTDVNAAALVPAAILFAAQESFGYGLAPPLTSARSPFTTTLSTATWLALRASAPPTDSASGTTGFYQSSTVTVGGVPCTVAAASSDGAWAVVRTPLSGALCAATDDCGYESLAVTSTVVRNGSVTLACPPFCPGAFIGAVPVPVSATAASVSIVPAWPQHSAFPAPVSASTLAAAASTGIFYARACAAGSSYTDPASGSCINASDPTSALCAFGSGDGCIICPSGALCPGGYRLWTRVGFYAPTELAGVVQVGAQNVCERLKDVHTVSVLRCRRVPRPPTAVRAGMSHLLRRDALRHICRWV